MGMFDHLVCEYPLPPPFSKETRFQTKDTGSTLDTVTLRADGSLWGEDYEIEDRSDPNATGLAALSGMCTRTHIRPRFLSGFTGPLTFYADYGPRNAEGWGTGWVEFTARFMQGQLKSLVMTENRAPKEAVLPAPSMGR